MRRRGFKDRYPSLPPGVTPSDIDRHFGEAECPLCGNIEREGHAEGCPVETDYCAVCRPMPEKYLKEYDEPALCDEHTKEDLEEMKRQIAEQVDDQPNENIYRNG